MTRYMLDTNTVSHLVRSHSAVARRVSSLPMSVLCLSAITHGELVFGLARRPDATHLRRAVGELLARVDVLPWDSEAAERYGAVRAELERRGRVLAPLDLLIASHALTVGAVLATADAVFGQVPDLLVEDWTAAA